MLVFTVVTLVDTAELKQVGSRHATVQDALTAYQSKRFFPTARLLLGRAARAPLQADRRYLAARSGRPRG